MNTNLRYTPVGKEWDSEGTELVDFFLITKSEAVSILQPLKVESRHRKLFIVFAFVTFAVAVYLIVVESRRRSYPVSGSVDDHLCNINGDAHLCYCPSGMYGSETVVYNNLWARCFQGKICHVPIHFGDQRIAEYQSCLFRGGCYNDWSGQCYYTKIEDLMSSVDCDEDSSYEAFCPNRHYVRDNSRLCIYGKMCQAPSVGSNVTITGGCYDIYHNKCQ